MGEIEIVETVKRRVDMESRTSLVTELAETKSLADVFFESGMFKDLQTQSQAIVKILAGRELGLSPIESMTNLYMVEGKIALQSKAIAGLIKRSKTTDYSIEKHTDEECTLVFYKLSSDGKREEVGKSTFTIKDAAKAGIVNKAVWKNYPKNMLFNRALSNGAKWYCPEVYSGYTTDEAEEFTPAEKQQTVITLTPEGKVEDGTADKKSV